MEYNGCWYKRAYEILRTPISQDLAATGFLIERLLEPQPTEDFRHVNPKDYERLTKNPWFLAIRAVKKD